MKQIDNVTIEELIYFTDTVIGILENNGFHVSSLDDATHCINRICKEVNNMETVDAVMYANCACEKCAKLNTN